jgi:hypothetical protein
MIEKKLLDAKVAELLGLIQSKRLASLGKLTLTVLLNKNPYLYQSLGLTRPEDFVDALLAARVSSSDETIFGNDFFEPLALWSAKAADVTGRTTNVSSAAGADIEITDDHYYYAISVKSGKNIFNSQSTKGQSTEFAANQGRMKKLGKSFLPLIGYGYGRKKHDPDAMVDKKAGQDFWALLTQEQDFYLRISDSISTCATAHKKSFDTAYEVKRAMLVKEFMVDFTDASGVVEWKKVVQFNSASIKPKRAAKKIIEK